ncbi:uncharacterized protein KZ484_017945 [Pholidichthys leucotaenia]
MDYVEIAETPQQADCKDELPPDQQFCNQERKAILDREEPEPSLINQEDEASDPPQFNKELKEDLHTSQEGEQLVVKQESDTIMVASVNEEDKHSEAEPNSEPLLSKISAVTETQDEEECKHVVLESVKEEEPEPKKRRLQNRSHSDDDSLTSKTHCENETVAPHLCDCKEEDALAVPQLCNQERNSSLNRAEEVKEEKLWSSQEDDKLELKQETDKFLVTPIYEEHDYSRTEPKSGQLLCQNTAETDNREQGGSNNVNPLSTKHEELEPDSQINSVDNSPMCENQSNSDSGEKSIKCAVKDKAILNESQMKKRHRIHSLVKPNVCEICGDRFSQKGNLSLHMRIHTVQSSPSKAGNQSRKIPQTGMRCDPMCRQKCSEKITEAQRRVIFDTYWNKSYTERKDFIFHMVSQSQTKQLVSDKPSKSLLYHLNDNHGQQQEVCKTFFLLTLGFHPENDRQIASAIGNTTSSNLSPPQDDGLKHVPVNKLDMAPIYEHIESFSPTINHYRYKHAPDRRYLPSDLSIQMMYQDYKANKAPKCSYETYRRALKEKNVTITKLGEKECEHCLNQQFHMEAEHRVRFETSTDICIREGNAIPNCLTCQIWERHKKRAEKGSYHYKSDADKHQPDDLSIRIVDLQKIIMLPRMPGVKATVFTKRISAFYETFATVGKKSPLRRKNISIIWHEGIAGRNAEEAASAYVSALLQERDIKHAIYWVDNCTAQNKNWCLLTALVTMVNNSKTALEDVTLKYFEPGHTFVSADSFHCGVEKEMKKQSAGVLDFEDFRNVIASSNAGKVNVVELRSENILAWKAGHSLDKLKKAPHLSDMAVIQLRRGSRDMFFKLSHDEEEFVQLDFLVNKMTLEFPGQLRPGDKGIEKQKKFDIVSKLCPLMPPNRRQFWENLAEED